MENVTAEIFKRTQAWVANTYFSDEDRCEIQALIDANNQKEINDRFFTELEFGTGGIRGVVEAGINRMNVYNVRRATQGLVNYAKAHFGGEQTLKAVICHDSRNSSPLFAEETARIMIANGVTVYMFAYPSATPLHSFAIRHLKCHFGVNITASHNPPEYNGYKVFWDKGEQVVPPADKGIIDHVYQIKDYSSVHYHTGDLGQIHYIDDDIIHDFFNAFEGCLIGDMSLNETLHVKYSALHGVGYKFIREFAAQRNFKQISFVDNQCKPDGDFPTIKTPNPEELTAYQEALAQSGKETDLIITTDPDADRIGCMARDANGAFKFISGNHLGCIILKHMLENFKQKDKLNKASYIVTTVVSTPLAEKIADQYNVKTYYCHTGFKNIAEIVNANEAAGNREYIFSFEESHGYMIGDYVRDKDGLSAMIMISEIAAKLKHQGKTLWHDLEAIFRDYGCYVDGQKNFVLKGIEGKEKIKSLMATLRSEPPPQMSTRVLSKTTDYLTLKIKHIQKQIEEAFAFKPADTLEMHYGEDIRIIVRPSGTEPKIKFYLTVKSTKRESAEQLLAQTSEELSAFVRKHLD